MAEAMTVETIIQTYWQIQGYWTEIRYPVRTIHPLPMLAEIKNSEI